MYLYQEALNTVEQQFARLAVVLPAETRSLPIEDRKVIIKSLSSAITSAQSIVRQIAAGVEFDAAEHRRMVLLSGAQGIAAYEGTKRADAEWANFIKSSREFNIPVDYAVYPPLRQAYIDAEFKTECKRLGLT